MRLDASLSCAGLPALGLRASGGTPAPTPAIAAPIVSTAASLPGDTRPTYAIDFVAAQPGGGGVGDTLEGRWGMSLVAMQAMAPASVTIDEGMFVDGDDPLPALGTFSEAQALGTTIYFQFRVVRGAESSDWSNTGTLLLVDGTMDSLGLADLTGQAASTRVWSAPFSVSGLAPGAWARLTGTGPIRVGGITVYEVGEQAQVQNGASVECGVDTSAGSGVTVDNVVSNRGVALETFSATTAGIIPLTMLSAVGDSITEHDSCYAELYAADNPGVAFFNEGVGGDGVTDMTARIADIMANDPSHITLLCGANDLMEFASAADYYTNGILAFVAAARAIKPSVVIGVCATLFIDEDAAANSPPGKAGFNARAVELWALCRAGVGVDFEFYVPIGEHPEYTEAGMAEGGTYSIDGLHLNQTGAYGPAHETYAAVMDAILAEAAGSTPSAFAFTDQANAAASSVQTARAVITGMGMGATATMSGSGDGDFTRNQGTFGTSTFPMMNGDFAVARLTASSTPSEQLDEIITVGGVSDTFSVTTAAASGADFDATANAQTFDGEFAGGNSHTFTAVPHPGGVPFLAIRVGGGRAVTALTVNGISMSAVPSMASDGTQFYIDAALGNLAAGSYDIAVTCDDSLGLVEVFYGALTGITSASPIDTANLAYGFHFDGVQNASSEVTLGSGDIGIFLGNRDPGVNISAFGPSGSLVKDYGAYFWVKFTGSGTPTFTTDAFSNTSIAAGGLEG